MKQTTKVTGELFPPPSHPRNFYLDGTDGGGKGSDLTKFFLQQVSILPVSFAGESQSLGNDETDADSFHGAAGRQEYLDDTR
jgi:hypothetical protein